MIVKSENICTFTGEIGRISYRLKGEVPTPSHLLFGTSLKYGTMKKEIWKGIPGYEGYYQVSSFGNVKSLDRVIPHKRYKKQHLSEKLLVCKNHQGYRAVRLCKKGEKRLFLVHRLVLLTFIGRPEKKQTDINHINCDKGDNRIENLEYCTRSENIIHSYVNGTHPLGQSHHRNKLSINEHQDIKNLREKGYTFQYIADLYNISSSTVYYIINDYPLRKCEAR